MKTVGIFSWLWRYEPDLMATCQTIGLLVYFEHLLWLSKKIGNLEVVIDKNYSQI